ncbi:MAG: bifunctional lysylphosphatidylglycerol flippase/synthetase MprF [[Lactobacillus] timonensis]|jgi:phosphatidylglycerol lysyltransferase|uniref:bifunctional lysylphosphatidylglycerol flippase/synthetase MprF n=1 Tax=[Lactobacillus] timonensis TaxID=1970790 RepID=UPI002356865B|nr:bifunctional lysylphosphatidylglycerol flippase/synthetase MprF [[Lactobacillus] timonensis]MCI1287861.1 bifunctional lysylphosphatidylglycerol flippase/synthetase MprF [[Lactobacillus] timonensis]MCI1926582.1 bifunctional lysylphosphatidylglycerol flippase/synthetase MprF [[Lactobacillus] timonensis]MCI1957991.1 bifunctional lysylphosphatidylglycerol flippase/synthetase MprF [[Lactobacillus] timonensis]
MQAVRRWWQRNGRIVKVIFVLSVVLFVVVALTSFLRQVDWHKVGTGLASLSPLSILIMLVCGCLAITPMLGYDFAVVKLLKVDFSPLYIIRSGWVTNTINNIAGFGGLIGGTLRAYFYGRKNEKKGDVLIAISKITVFLMSGLSVLCWLALLLILTSKTGVHLHRYILWLILGGCYSPLLIIITQARETQLFADLTVKLESFVIISSTLEWLLVALFFILVGFMMGIHVPVAAVLPLYVIAQIVGILSMIPGALGSFDIIMMMELSMLGVHKSTAVIWLLLFRVFYYLVPLAISLIMSLAQLSQKVNNYFDDLPRQALHQLAYYLLTTFMYLSGILMLLAACLPDLTTGNKFLMKFYPFTFFFLHQLTTMLFAIALLACARGLQAKLTKAYWPTLVILGIGIVNTIWNLGTISLTVFLVFVFILVLMSRRTLYRKKFVYSLGKLIFDITIFFGSLAIYFVIGVINRPRYLAAHHIPDFLLFPGEKIWLSGFVGLLLGLVVMFIMMGYFTTANDPFLAVDSFRADRIRKVIDQFGGNETSHLAFLRDKFLYFYQQDGQDQLYLMYQLKYDKIIVMGEPVGNQAVLRNAFIDFINKADLYGYQPLFYEVSEKTTMMLHEFGFDFIKTGEDGRVNLANFTLAGKRQRSQRALMHKFDREGYQFSIEQPPFSDPLLNEMRTVSNDWLGDQVEKGFSLGFFEDYYVNQAPVGIVRNKDGRMVAFATFMPTGSKKLLTIDLMRHSKDAPSGIMDKVFISMFLYGQEHGYQEFDLGMAPLSNVGQSRFSFLEEKIAHFIYEYGYRFYGFQGLRRYKAKYADRWEGRYTVYRKKNSIISNILALVIVINQPVHRLQRIN